MLLLDNPKKTFKKNPTLSNVDTLWCVYLPSWASSFGTSPVHRIPRRATRGNISLVLIFKWRGHLWIQHNFIKCPHRQTFLSSLCVTFVLMWNIWYFKTQRSNNQNQRMSQGRGQKTKHQKTNTTVRVRMATEGWQGDTGKRASLFKSELITK